MGGILQPYFLGKGVCLLLRARKKALITDRIIKEMEAIAFSEEEKTSDRLRALDYLSSKTQEGAKVAQAWEKLDLVLSKLGE